MECIKTGGLAYLDNYGEVVRGDIFRVSGNIVLIRVCERNVPGDASHAFISIVNSWFDENKPGTSTLIGTMTQFNYDGI